MSKMAKSLDEIVADFRNRSLEDLEYPIIWLDAMQIKIREAGHVVKVAVVIARSSASASSPRRT